MVPALWATPQKPVGLNTSPVSCALITGFWGCDGDMAKDRTQPIQLSSIVKTWRHSPAAGAIFRPGWRVARRKIYTRHTLSCLVARRKNQDCFERDSGLTKTQIVEAFGQSRIDYNADLCKVSDN